MRTQSVIAESMKMVILDAAPGAGKLVDPHGAEPDQVPQGQVLAILAVA
jgi:biotin carboxyl carrier protein